MTTYLLFHEIKNKFNQHSELLIFIMTDRNLFYYIQIKKSVALCLFELLMMNRNLFHYTWIKKFWNYSYLILVCYSFHYTQIKKFWDCYCLISVWTAHNWLKFVLLYSNQDEIVIIYQINACLSIDCLWLIAKIIFLYVFQKSDSWVQEVNECCCSDFSSFLEALL